MRLLDRYLRLSTAYRRTCLPQQRFLLRAAPNWARPARRLAHDADRKIQDYYTDFRRRLSARYFAANGTSPAPLPPGRALCFRVLVRRATRSKHSMGSCSFVQHPAHASRRAAPCMDSSILCGHIIAHEWQTPHRAPASSSSAPHADRPDMHPSTAAGRRPPHSAYPRVTFRPSPIQLRLEVT